MNSFVLHIIAMFCMLLDHIYRFGLVSNTIFTCIGRIAFPIFAFMIVEGYFKTKDLKKYIFRLFIFGLISEIPFNLMKSGLIFYKGSQNVLWTFLIGLCLIWIMEKVKNKKIYIRSLVLIAISFLAIVLGVIVSCDYHYAGILTVLVFYIFRGKKWYLMLSQFICLYYINSKMLGGTTYEYELFGISICYIRQKLAVLSLIPIWFYNEKQGFYNKYIKYFYYVYYPCHIVLLWLIKLVIKV